MKLLKVLRRVFGILCALSAAVGLTAWLYYFNKTAECPYCALPEGLNDEEIKARLAETHDVVAVLEDVVQTLFVLFWVFLLALVITVSIDLLARRATSCVNMKRPSDPEETV